MMAAGLQISFRVAYIKNNTYHIKKDLMMTESIDEDVRHYIYKTFAATTLPPTTSQVAGQFGVSIASIENAFERLANAHQIALAPGGYSIWMAHPFSSVPTNYVATIGSKEYYGN
jgi:hypothetical protein